MESSEALKQLLQLSKDIYASEPMLVGGIPRDLLMGNDTFAEGDIDITTNDFNSARLAITFASKNNVFFKMFDDGHISIYFDSFTLDFSSNFVSEDAVNYITKELNITDKTYFEVYSRDFTINSLHKKFLTDEIIDVTGLGQKDINDKLIRTILPASITLKDDPRRAYRAINFAARFGFEIHESILDFVRENPSLFSAKSNHLLTQTYITSIISKSLEKNADLTINYLIDMGLFNEIPLVGKFKDEVIKRKMVIKYLDKIQP